MMDVTIFYPAMVVHRADCAVAAMERARTLPDTIVSRSGETLDAILAEELSVDLAAMGYTADDFDVKACAR
jgi:hypothetical protein